MKNFVSKRQLLILNTILIFLCIFPSYELRVIKNLNDEFIETSIEVDPAVDEVSQDGAWKNVNGKMIRVDMPSLNSEDMLYQIALLLNRARKQYNSNSLNNGEQQQLRTFEKSNTNNRFVELNNKRSLSDTNYRKEAEKKRPGWAIAYGKRR